MRLLITGGAGFIGSHIADQALQLGWNVAIIDDLSTGHRENIPEGAEFHHVDIRNRNEVFAAFRSFRPDAVTHQAAQASVAISVRKPHFDAEINVLGSINVIDACVEHGVGRFAFASTGGAIYGEVAEGVQATVSTPPQPVSPYAASKFAVENYLRCYRHEHALHSTVLRYANVYGPRQDPHGEAGVVAIFLKRILASESICINARRESGDDGCVRDYVHIGDVVRANIAAVQGHIDDPILNICTGIGTSTRELATQLERAVQVSAITSNGAPRAGDVERSVLCPGRFKEYFERTVTIEEGLKSTSDWFHDHLAVGALV